mgnify:CR=1 FL=1
MFQDPGPGFVGDIYGADFNLDIFQLAFRGEFNAVVQADFTELHLVATTAAVYFPVEPQPPNTFQVGGHFLQGPGQGCSPRVDPGGNGLQAVRPVVHPVGPGHDSQQHLGGTDIGGCLIPFNMLFPGLQGHPQGGFPVHILAEPDNPSRDASLVVFPGSKIRGMRAAVPHRHTETLRAADHSVGAHLPGRGQQDKAEQIGRDRHQGAGPVGRLEPGVGPADQAADPQFGGVLFRVLDQFPAQPLPPLRRSQVDLLDLQNRLT